MRWIKTTNGGPVASLLLIAAVTVTVTWTSRDFAYASPELLRAMTGIGASFFLAYIIEVSWMVPRADRDDFDQWLGFAVGIAVAGLIGICVALLVAEHRAAGHGNLLDDLGLWWSVFSLAFLGLMVALQPLIVHSWSGPNDSRDSD